MIRIKIIVCFLLILNIILFPYIVIAFTLHSAGDLSTTNIALVFTADVDTNTGTNIYNYFINKGIGYPQKATVSGNLVRLKVTPMTVWTNYQVIISNILNTTGTNLSPDPTTSNPIQVKSVTAEADYILSCQLSDGGIRWDQVPGAPVHPYFGSYAALGLIDAYKYNGNTNYLRGAREWLYWYRAHMEPDGTIYDHYESGGTSVKGVTRDSTDGYAGVFLYAVYNYYLATNDTTFLNNIYTAVTQAVKGIELTYQSDGLTEALPTYHTKYLMDNIEVWQGLDAAYKLALIKNDYISASNANYKAEKTLNALETLYRGDEFGYYFYFKQDGGITNFSIEGLANMFAIDILLDSTDPRASLIWNTVKSNIFPNNVPPSTNSIECDQWYWYIISAMRLNDADMRDIGIACFANKWNSEKYTHNSGHNIRRMLFNDYTSPAQISLTANGTNTGEVELKWAAPGDDNNSGTSYGYLIKCAPTKIENYEDFRNVYFVQKYEPIPNTAGTTQSFIAEELIPGQAYYFTIIAFDDKYNYSPLATNVLVTAGGTNTVVYQIVDDFEIDDNTNAFGGNNVSAYAGSAYVSANRVSGYPDWARGGMIGGEKVIYSNCTGWPNYGYLQFDFNGARNLSQYNYISIWVRKEGTNSVACNVQLYDGVNSIPRVLNDYLPGGKILNYWQEAIVPLDAFDTAGGITLNRSSIQRLEFVFDGVWNSTKGVLYFDDIKFIDDETLPVIYVNNHEFRSNDIDPNSLNGEIIKYEGGTSSLSYSTLEAKHGNRSYRFQINISGVQYTYILNELSSYSSYPGTPLHYFNVNGVDNLKMCVKGNGTNQSFRVYIQQDTTGSPPGYNEPRTVYGVNSEWELIKVPLFWFSACPKNQVGVVKLAWEAQDTTANCIMYVDDIYFESDFYDMNSPVSPTNVAATNIGSGVKLSWSAPTNNGDIDLTLLKDLLGYDIYRSTNSIYSNYVKINTNTITGLTYNDINPGLNKTNYYIIVAKDSKTIPNISLGSVPVSIYFIPQPSLSLSKEVSNVSLDDMDVSPIPGASVLYMIHYINSGLGNATNVVIYDAIPSNTIYLTNSSTSPSGWTNQYSTNTSPSQSFNSPDYINTEPAANQIKWIRWKNSIVNSMENGNLYYKVMIK